MKGESLGMKQMRIVLFAAVFFVTVAARAQQPAPTIASAVDGEITLVESEVVGAAEAMPESKFDFSPESLHLPGADYKGVRTFARELKHVAYSNYVLWSPPTGDKIPKKYASDTLDSLKTKAEIIQFLKESFALGHKAAAALTAQNLLQTGEGGKSTFLYLATFGAAHALDHYGQMVEYLRMNGIVTPASR
jgi:hypothetical protein